MGIQKIRIRRCMFAGISVLLLAGNALTACGKEAKQQVQAPELIAPADTVKENAYAERRNVYTITSLESVVLPYQEELSFQHSGVIKSIEVHIGQEVEEGQILAVLEDSAAAQYQSLCWQLESMRDDNEYNNRYEEIEIEIAKCKGKDMAREELELKQKKEIQAFEEAHLLSKIKKLEKEFENNWITAPFTGTVTAIADVAPGAAVAEKTPVIVLASEDSKYVKTDYVNEKTIAASKDYYALIDGEPYALEYIPYTSEELAAMTANEEKLLSGYMLKDAEDAAFGKNAFVCIVQDYRENVIAVPKSALYKERRDYYVYRMDGERRVKTPVQVGVIGDMYAEIISGLEEGACVYVE